MGACNSKNTPRTASQHGGQDAAAAAATVAGAQDTEVKVPATAASPDEHEQQPAGPVPDPEPKTPVSSVAADEYPETPGPRQTTSVDGSSPHKYHKYNSMEKPYRSAMRSGDGRADTSSRRSSLSMTNVGFFVGDDAPDSEGHKQIEGAKSISLKKIVDIFYEKVVADPKIGHFFVGIDLGKLKRHQVRTMALAFGGKELVYDEDPNMNLRKIHYHLIRDKGLDLSDWECFVGLFDETLEQLEREIPADTRQAASRSIRATRHYFVPIGQETEYTSAPIIQVPVPSMSEEQEAAEQPAS